jgi:hypothetical protein
MLEQKRKGNGEDRVVGRRTHQMEFDGWGFFVGAEHQLQVKTGGIADK